MFVKNKTTLKQKQRTKTRKICFFMYFYDFAFGKWKHKKQHKNIIYAFRMRQQTRVLFHWGNPYKRSFFFQIQFSLLFFFFMYRGYGGNSLEWKIWRYVYFLFFVSSFPIISFYLFVLFPFIFLPLEIFFLFSIFNVWALCPSWSENANECESFVEWKMYGEKNHEISGNLEVEILDLKTLYFSPWNVKIGGSF